MAGRLEGKRALVTAAGQGIGRAIAEAFAAEGAAVTATDLDEGKLAGLETQGVACARLDVTDGAAVEALVASLGLVHVLCNAAGIVHHGTVLERAEGDWDVAFNVNVRSMDRTIRAVLPGMLAEAKAGRLGSIVNIASAASSLKAAPQRYVYATTKAAVLGLTRSVAIDFVRDGVRCNAICPGTVRSPSWEARVAAVAEEKGGYDKALDWFVSRQPMGRVGEAAEIAALAVFLASDESAFMTGQALVIDGGWTL